MSSIPLSSGASRSKMSWSLLREDELPCCARCPVATEKPVSVLLVRSGRSKIENPVSARLIRSGRSKMEKPVPTLEGAVEVDTEELKSTSCSRSANIVVSGIPEWRDRGGESSGKVF